MLAPWDRGLKFWSYSRLDGITTKPRDIHQLSQGNRNMFRGFPFPAIRASLPAADGQIDVVHVQGPLVGWGCTGSLSDTCSGIFRHRWGL